MVALEDLWDGLKQDLSMDTMLDMIIMTPNAEFDKYQAEDGVSYLCEAAVVFRCDIEVFKAICMRTRDPQHFRRLWYTIVAKRAPKDFCLFLAQEYLDKGLVEIKETQTWIMRCIRGECRIWFWKEVVDRQLARITDKSELKTYFAAEGGNLPVGVRAYLCTALGMPENFE